MNVEALVKGVVCSSQDVTVVAISKQDNATWTLFQIFMHLDIGTLMNMDFRIDTLYMTNHHKHLNP